MDVLCPFHQVYSNASVSNHRSTPARSLPPFHTPPRRPSRVAGGRHQHGPRVAHVRHMHRSEALTGVRKLRTVTKGIATNGAIGRTRSKDVYERGSTGIATNGAIGGCERSY